MMIRAAGWVVGEERGDQQEGRLNSIRSQPKGLFLASSLSQLFTAKGDKVIRIRADQTKVEKKKTK